MPDVAALSVKIDADTTGLESGINRANQSVSGLGSAIQSAMGAAALGAVAGLGAAFVGSVKSAADFEKGLSAISAVSGATKAELEGIRSTALQLGKDTSFSASEAAAGMEEMVKAGVSLNDVIGGAGRAALDLAAAGGLSVAESATIASNAMNVFSLKGSDMAHVADVIAGAANASAIDVHDFGFSLSAVGAVAATVGLGLEDTATAIAVLGQAGLKGSDAGTSLKTMLLNLSPATKPAISMMKELGIITATGANQFFTAEGKAKSLAEVSGILQNALKGLTKEQQLSALQTMFGTDAIRAAAIMAKAGSEGFTEMAESMSKVTAQAVAQERLNNVAGSFETLKGSVETAAIMLGSFFLPEIKRAMDGATDAVNGAIGIIEQIPDAIETVKQVIAGDWAPADSIHPFVNEVGKAAVMLSSTFGPAITAAGAILQRLGAWFTANIAPIAAFASGFLGAIAAAGLLSAAIAGVTAVLGLLLSPLGAVAIAVGLLAVAWQTNFLAIRDVVALVLNGEIKAALDLFLTNLTAMTVAIAAQLLLWAQEFVAWVAPMIPPFLAAVADFAAQFFAWIAAQLPGIIAQLTLWGQEFVAWVAPQIPPLLAALTALGAALLAWLVAQIPPIIAQLVLWGAEFVAWVAPQIDPMVRALGTMALALIDWIIAQVPTIVSHLVEWGLLFGAWVLGTAIPELAKALPGILTTINAWIQDATVAIAQRMVDFGKSWVQGIWEGFTAAWSQIGPRITETIKSVFVMPGFGGGGGGGAQTLSYTGTGAWQATTAGGFANNAERLAFVRQVAGEYGHDPETVARGAMLEGAGAAGPVGDSGRSFGALQAYTGGGQGNSFMQQTGLDPSDPNNEKALVRWQIANLGQTGWQPFHGPSNAGFAPFQGINRGAPPAGLRNMQKTMLGAPGMNPAEWPGFMQQVNEQLPDYLLSLATIQQSGAATFTGVALSAAVQGAAMVTASTDSLGNVTRVYSENGVAIGATITNTAGQIVNTWGTMGTAVVESTGAMAAGALTSVTDLGTGTMTITTDMAGNTVATITDMAGNVTSQYSSMGADVTAQTAATSEAVTAQTATMAQNVLTSVTDMGTGVLTITTDTSGQTVATITDMAGNVTSTYSSMGTDVTGSVTDMAGTVVEQFGNVAESATKTEAPIRHFGDTVKNLKPPDLSGFVKEFEKVTKAANKAADAVATVEGKGGKKGGGGGKDDVFGKAAGGWVLPGQTTLVGERGPEIISTQRPMYVTPNDRLDVGGGSQRTGDTYIFNGVVPETVLDRMAAEQRKADLMHRIRG